MLELVVDFLTKKKKGVNMGKIESKGRDILRRQFYDRSRRSRNETKLENGRKAIYNTISSKNSLRQHESQWKQFAHYVEEKYSVKSLKKIDEKLVRNYLNSLQKQGFAEKTLKSRVSAINHVMVGSGVWKENQKISLKNLRSKKLIATQYGPRKVYKGKTSSEWINAHREAYMSSRNLVDFVLAFGLRRSEIFGKSGSKYQGVTFRNLGHLKGSKFLFVEVIGKGGKYRIATVRADMAQEMWEEYGLYSREYQQEYFEKDTSERENILKASSDRRERIFTQNKQSIPLHIHRNEYVRQKLSEAQIKYEQKFGKLVAANVNEKTTGYTRIGFKHIGENLYIYKTVYKDSHKFIEKVEPSSIVKIADWRGYVISACEVMENIGHNRLDVLLKYLN